MKKYTIIKRKIRIIRLILFFKNKNNLSEINFVCYMTAVMTKNRDRTGITNKFLYRQKMRQYFSRQGKFILMTRQDLLSVLFIADVNTIGSLLT